MIAFDTNHLIRHIVMDDDSQCRKVAELVKQQVREGGRVRIFDLVLLETGWVLQSLYGFDRNAWIKVLEVLLNDSLFLFDDSRRLWRTLDRYRKGKADFADYMILGLAEGSDCEFKTFDKKLAKELL